MEFPSTNFEGKEYAQVGCRKCRGGTWKIFSTGRKFMAECASCGFQRRLPPAVLIDESAKPEVENTGQVA